MVKGMRLRPGLWHVVETVISVERRRAERVNGLGVADLSPSGPVKHADHGNFRTRECSPDPVRTTQPQTRTRSS